MNLSLIGGSLGPAAGSQKEAMKNVALESVTPRAGAGGGVGHFRRSILPLFHLSRICIMFGKEKHRLKTGWKITVLLNMFSITRKFFHNRSQADE